MKWTKLPQEQLKQFDDNGYLIIRNALSLEDINALIEAGDKLIDSGCLKNRQVSSDSSRYDSFRNIISLDGAFLPLLAKNTTFPLICQLMGPRLQLHTSHLIWKHADPEGSNPDVRLPGWHRDMSPVVRDLEHSCMPRLEIKVAYYLTDCVEPDCGQTIVVPGSHRWKSLKLKAGKDPEGATIPSLQAGDALLFENRTLHAGGANLSGRTRKTIMFGYSHDWLRPDDYDKQTDELLDKCNPVERALLDGSTNLYDEKGQFAPKGIGSALVEFAEANGCTTA